MSWQWFESEISESQNTNEQKKVVHIQIICVASCMSEFNFTINNKNILNIYVHNFVHRITIFVDICLKYRNAIQTAGSAQYQLII